MIRALVFFSFLISLIHLPVEASGKEKCAVCFEKVGILKSEQFDCHQCSVCQDCTRDYLRQENNELERARLKMLFKTCPMCRRPSNKELEAAILTSDVPRIRELVPMMALQQDTKKFMLLVAAQSSLASFSALLSLSDFRQVARTTSNLLLNAVMAKKQDITREIIRLSLIGNPRKECALLDASKELTAAHLLAFCDKANYKSGTAQGAIQRTKSLPSSSRNQAGRPKSLRRSASMN